MFTLITLIYNVFRLIYYVLFHFIMIYFFLELIEIDFVSASRP